MSTLVISCPVGALSHAYKTPVETFTTRSEKSPKAAPGGQARREDSKTRVRSHAQTGSPKSPAAQTMTENTPGPREEAVQTPEPSPKDFVFRKPPETTRETQKPVETEQPVKAFPRVLSSATTATAGEFMSALGNAAISVIFVDGNIDISSVSWNGLTQRGKKVITGATGVLVDTLRLPAKVQLAEEVTFAYLTLRGQNSTLFANGHALTLGPELQTQSMGVVYGGGELIPSSGTNVVVKSGHFAAVYGGGDSTGATVSGDTRVEISGGTVGEVFGGGRLGGVQGSTHVRVSGGVLNFVDGGSFSGTVTGNVNITVSGTPTFQSGASRALFGSGSQGGVVRGKRMLTYDTYGNGVNQNGLHRMADFDVVVLKQTTFTLNADPDLLRVGVLRLSGGRLVVEEDMQLPVVLEGGAGTLVLGIYTTLTVEGVGAPVIPVTLTRTNVWDLAFVQTRNIGVSLPYTAFRGLAPVECSQQNLPPFQRVGFFVPTATKPKTYAITESYQDTKGKRLRVDTQTVVEEGKDYKKTHPSLSGYLYTGYRIDGGTLKTGEPTLSKVMAAHSVTFVYRLSGGTTSTRPGNAATGDPVDRPLVLLFAAIHLSAFLGRRLLQRRKRAYKPKRLLR